MKYTVQKFEEEDNLLNGEVILMSMIGTEKIKIIIVLETEYSWTSFWQSELEFHISDKEDTPLDWGKTEFQNQVQIFDCQNFAQHFIFHITLYLRALKVMK